MKRTKTLLLLSLTFGLAVLNVSAQNVQHLNVTRPGGMPGNPLITGVQRGATNLTVTWDGPSGYYQLFERTNLDVKWQALGGATNLVRRATVNARYSNAFFKVSGPAPHYAGSQTCLECHSSILKTESHTRHSGAFTNAFFVASGGQTNSSCLPCHTVGYGVPTGFISKAKTPQLGGVQCENCHGPAANHAANPDDVAVRPRVEIAATVCGGCHTGPQTPTFDEWNTSAHAQVVMDMNATNRIDSCGRCHSGSSRLALLDGKALPKGDANMGIVCITCHDPHQTNSNPAQLRNPIASTNDYFMATTDVFSKKYNASISICAQCHNHRGATWTDTTRAPHPSLQYNMLLGTVGELDSGLPHYEPASHALLITNQCVACHMQTAPFQSETQPAVTGHSFRVDTFNMCRSCHPLPEALAQFTQGAISNQIQQVKFSLDYWATNKAPATLQAKYGAKSWEYTTPGSLSSGGAGPNATEQAQIPVNIQKARFNLYIVLGDGSFGVHNGPYAISLLDTAQNWIDDELDK